MAAILPFPFVKFQLCHDRFPLSKILSHSFNVVQQFILVMFWL